jgi:RimJ/RimL family protein N-acetyltransferase
VLPSGIGLAPDYPIATARLLLRPLDLSDADALLSYHSLESVHRYLPMGPFDRAVVVERITEGPWAKTTLDHEGDAMCLGVEDRATGQLVGDVMLRWHSEKHASGEIGYVIHPDYAGQGYATEASRSLLQLAFDDLGLHRVTAHIVQGNEPSLRVARRLGLRQEAHHVESIRVGPAWSDHLVFALLEQEWRAQPCSPAANG